MYIDHSIRNSLRWSRRMAPARPSCYCRPSTPFPDGPRSDVTSCPRIDGILFYLALPQAIELDLHAISDSAFVFDSKV